MAISLDNILGIHQHAVLLRSQRHGVLAANLANADTPNYKARDMDFQAALARAEGKDQWPGMRTTHARHIPEGGGAMGLTDMKYRVPLQPSVDGNTVDSRLETVAFMKNSIDYQVSLRLLDRKVSGIKRVLRGER